MRQKSGQSKACVWTSEALFYYLYFRLALRWAIGYRAKALPDNFCRYLLRNLDGEFLSARQGQTGRQTGRERREIERREIERHKYHKLKETARDMERKTHSLNPIPPSAQQVPPSLALALPHSGPGLLQEKSHQMLQPLLHAQLQGARCAAPTARSSQLTSVIVCFASCWSWK